MQPLCSRSITEPSSLLQAAPPLCSASVLSSLKGPPLGFLPSRIRATGSHVPYKSLMIGSRRLYAGRQLISKQVSSRLVPGHRLFPGFDAIYTCFDTSTADRLHSSPYLIPDRFNPAFSLTLTTRTLYLSSLSLDSRHFVTRGRLPRRCHAHRIINH